jgi:hypothetical protein
MFVSQGLVGPKAYRNSSTPKGKQVNIPVPSGRSRKALTLRDMPGRFVCLSKQRSPWSTAMVRIGRTCDGVTRQILGAREKGAGCPYREPTQVPLAEEAKACRRNRV